VNLSGLQVNSTGGAALTATNVNNGSLTQSTLTSTNSATNGLSFSGISGIFDVNNSTITVAQPTNDGISVVDSTGIVSVAANPGSLITNAVNGVRVNNVSGGLTASGLEIVDSSQNGISATNSRNLTLQGNTIRNSGVDGINLNEVTGNITIANNSITNSVNNAIQFTNTTGQTELSISNNQVTNAGTINGFDGISIATAGDAVSTLTFSDNQFTNVGNRYAFYLDTNGNSSSNFIFSNNQVTSSPGVIGGVVLENNAPGSRLCLQMNGNTSSGASFIQYALSNNGNSQYQVVDLANVAVNNTGSLQFFGGPFTSVPVCPAP
jgi:hypothetical protein